MVIADNFFLQIINSPTYGKISDCFEKLPNIYQIFIDGIKKIIENDFKDLKKLIEEISKLVYAMIETLTISEGLWKVTNSSVELG